DNGVPSTTAGCWAADSTADAPVEDCDEGGGVTGACPEADNGMPEANITTASAPARTAVKTGRNCWSTRIAQFSRNYMKTDTRDGLSKNRTHPVSIGRTGGADGSNCILSGPNFPRFAIEVFADAPGSRPLDLSARR